MEYSVAELIDKLSIENIRVWMAEDRKRDPNATDKQIADMTRLTNTANQTRANLIQAIDESINKMILSGKPQRLSNQGSTKLYGK